MVHRSFETNRNTVVSAFIMILSALSVQGCRDWPDERGTAIQAQSILRDLGRIETAPDPNLPRPAIYKSPPQKLRQLVGGSEEWKLVYFCQYHTADQMKQIINEQFATKLFDEKGKSTDVTDYTVTSNPETNQLIVRCPLESDVDAVMEIIAATDIPPIQVRIDCMVSELYADLTVDRETSMLIEDLFGEEVTLSGEQSNDNLAFPGASLRDPARANFGLKIGIDSGIAGQRFQALVDLLVSRGYLKILMNPTLEVLNGHAAKISSRQHVPLQQIFLRYGNTSDSSAIIETKTEYYDVVDSLQITPHVFADGYIGLETQVQIASYLTPEGIKQTPIITERTVTNEDTRIRLGESLIIGGIRKSEKRDVIRGVPILKDIPGLNLLFSGRDFEERATEVIFILTPTISSGGQPNEEIVEMMYERHSSPLTQSLPEVMMDPLALRAREVESERQLEAAREAQQLSEAEMTTARTEALQAEHQVRKLSAEIEQTRMQAAEASNEAEKAVSTAATAKAEAEKATAQIQQARAQTENAGTSAAPVVGQDPAGPDS